MRKLIRLGLLNLMPLVTVAVSTSHLNAQVKMGGGQAEAKPYYYEIPAAPESYNAYTVAARMVDGLGFRYFWATEGLTDEDLDYKPSESSRTPRETLGHIQGLTRVVLNAVKSEPNGARGGDRQEQTFDEMRNETLALIKEASDLLKSHKEDQMSDYAMIFQRGDSSSEYPFWNVINGPLSDALWHVGQIVVLRRVSGNPFDSKVSVLAGKRRN